MRTVVGLFNGLGDAGRTAGALKELGLRSSQISVISMETAPLSGTSDLDLDRMNVAGIGEVAACGPMVQFLTPTTGASARDGLVQALVQMGLSGDEAKQYVEGVRRGYTLEAAVVDDDKVDEALAIMQRMAGSPERNEARPTDEEGIAASERTTSEDIRVPVVEEEIILEKREVQAGGLRVSTHVISQEIVEEISLGEETIDVERRPANRPADEGAFKEQTIEVTATAEQPVVTKRAKVVEDVVVKKDTKTRNQTVKETVRKTDVDVQRLDFDANAYQDHFKQNYGKTRNAKFDEYEPAYRFGQEMRGQSTGSDWSSVEAGAQSSWEQRRPGTWDRFKDAIRHAWQRAKS